MNYQKLTMAGGNSKLLIAEESTPLHLACSHRDHEKIQLLLDNGANINARDSSGRTPLMDYLDALIKHGHGNEVEKETLKLLLGASDLSISSTKNDQKPEFVWKIMLQHIAKLHMLNVPVHASFIEAISKNQEYQIYFLECTKEMLKAKETKFKN